MIIGVDTVRERLSAQFGTVVANNCVEELRSSPTYNNNGHAVVVRGKFDNYFIIAPEKYNKLFKRS